MRIRKEEQRLLRERNGMMGLPQFCGCKRKNAEDPCAEFVRTVIGAEATTLSPEDNFKRSIGEQNIFTSFSPREVELESSSENISAEEDVLLEGCAHSRGFPNIAIREKNGYRPARLEVSTLRNKGGMQKLVSPKIDFRGGEYDAGKYELKDSKEHNFGLAVPSNVKMQANTQDMYNAPEEIKLLQHWSSGTQSFPGCFLTVDKLDSSNRKKMSQDNEKSVYSREVAFSKYNQLASRGNHEVAGKLQVDVGNLKGINAQEEQYRRIDGNIRLRNLHEDTVDGCLSAFQVKEINQHLTSPNQHLTSPIVESSEGGMLLSCYAGQHPQEINTDNTIGVHRANESSGHWSSSLVDTSLKSGSLLSYNQVQNLAETKDSTMTLGLATNLPHGKIAYSREVNDKSKNTLEKFQSGNLPILSKEKQAERQLPLPKQRKMLRECAKARLLSAGWKIELKPRTGRDYKDSVYVSPWGSSYWSLPKAWHALRQSLDAATINSGKNYGSVQQANKKRAQDKVGDFWAELKDFLQFDSGKQDFDVSTSDQPSGVNPLMSMVFTEDLSLLKRRKKYRHKEDIDREDEDIKHCMKGHDDKQDCPLLESRQLEEKRTDKVDELGVTDSDRKVCVGRDISENISMMGDQGGLYRKLSNSRELKSMQGKLPDLMEGRIVHAGDLRNIYVSLRDDVKKMDTCGLPIDSQNERSMHGNLFEAPQQQNGHVKLSHVSNRSSPSGKMLHADNRRSVRQKLSNGEEQMSIHKELLPSANQRSVHGNLSNSEEQRDICVECLKSGNQSSSSSHGNVLDAKKQHGMLGELFRSSGQRSIPAKLSSFGDQSGIYEVRSQSDMHWKPLNGREQMCLHMKALHAKPLHTANQSNVHGMHINAVEQNSVDEKLFQVSDKINSQGKLLNVEKLQSTDNKTLDASNINCRKLSNAVEQMSIPSHVGEQRRIRDKLSHHGNQRRLNEKLLHTDELKEELFSQTETNGKIPQQETNGKSLHDELYNKSILKRLHIIQQQISDYRDAQRPSTKSLNGGAGNQLALYVVSGLEKPKYINSRLPLAAVQSDIAEVGEKVIKLSEPQLVKVGRKLDESGKGRILNELDLGSKSEEDQVYQAEKSYNQLEAGGQCDKLGFDENFSGPQESEVVKFLNETHVHQTGVNSTEQELSRKVSRKPGEPDIDSKLNKLHEDQAEINSIAPQVVRNIHHLEGSRQFDDPQDQEDEAGRNSIRPKVFTVLNGLEGSKQLDELQAGKAGGGSKDPLVCIQKNVCNDLQAAIKLNCSESSRTDKVSYASHIGRKSNNSQIWKSGKNWNGKNPNKLQEDESGENSIEVQVVRELNDQEGHRQFDEPQTGKVSRGSDDPQVGMPKNLCNVLQAGIKSNGLKAGKTDKISYASRIGRKSNNSGMCKYGEKASDKKSNRLLRDEIHRNSVELHGIGKLDDPAGGRHIDEMHSGKVGRCSDNPQVGMPVNVCNILQKTTKLNVSEVGIINDMSYTPQVGRKPNNSQICTSGKNSNEPKAVKSGRTNKPTTGRQFNRPKVDKYSKICTKNKAKIDRKQKLKIGDIFADDDNITLASMLINRKCARPFSKCSVHLSNKSKCIGEKADSFTQEKNKKHKGGCSLSVRTSNRRDTHSKGDKGFSSTSKRTVLSWLINTGVVCENESVKYMNENFNEIMKHGWITRDGILCKCCSRVLTTLNFIAHAGSKIPRPFSSICLQSGKSLTACQIEAWNAEYKSRKGGWRFIEVDESDQNDDACGRCGDGGDLICCDKCPSTFHQACLTLKDVPEGNWYCPNCTCAICGTVSYDEETSNISTLLTCDQCERKYHETCLHGRGIQAGVSKTTNTVFCGQDCEKVSASLHELLAISNHIEGGFSWMLLKSTDEKQKTCSTERLALLAECNLKLAVAITVMEECFDPMLDPRTGINMIPHVVYSWGSNFSRLNYQGFYTVVLEKGDELISVASIRIHGRSFAEMPLIGTSCQYRRQGMCRRLVNAIEEMLMLLKVEKLILSAIPELLETWTKAFGFKPLEDSDKEELKNLNMMTFPGTSLLQKYIFKAEMKKSIQREHVDQVTCAKGNVFDIQAQGDDAEKPVLEKTNTESPWHAPVSQEQGDDAENPVLEKTNTESPWHVPVYITNGNTMIGSPPSSIFPKVVETWKHGKGICGTLADEEERNKSFHEGSDLDAEALGDRIEIPMLEKVHSKSIWHLPSDITDVNTTAETASSGMLTKIEEKCKHYRGLDNLLNGVEETSVVCYNTSDLYAQVQPDSAEVTVLDRVCNESAHFIHNVIANSNLISDTASPQLLPKAEDFWKCNEGSNRTLRAEEERTRSCLKGSFLDSQVLGGSLEVHMPQKTDTKPQLCAAGDVAEVQAIVMTATSEMLSKEKESWAHDKFLDSVEAVGEERTMGQLVSKICNKEIATYPGLVEGIPSEDAFISARLDSCLHRGHLVEQYIHSTANFQNSASVPDPVHVDIVGSYCGGDNVYDEKKNIY